MSDRQDLARDLRARGWTYAAIGHSLGVSRQRAHQLVTGSRMARLPAVARSVMHIVGKHLAGRPEADHG